MKEKTKDKLYDSGINIMGSVPDYSVMIDYISDTYGITENSTGAFTFRTEKSLLRFVTAIETCVLKFNDEGHRQMFFAALANPALSVREKLLVLFWQLTYANRLFSKITSEVFMKAVYAGRLTLTADEVLSYLRYVRESEPDELQWSEGTLKISASKYLTMMKKLGLAEGTTKKAIQYPVITQRLFIYFIKFAISVCPGIPTLDNPFMVFAFSERQNLISRLKKIENIPYWDISQIGDEIRIDIKKQ